MICQHYSVQHQGGTSVPGQLVYRDDNSEIACGFIFDSYEDVIEIVLFDPTDLECEIIDSFKMDLEWPDMLVDALRRSTPEIRDVWAEIINPAN